MAWLMAHEVWPHWVATEPPVVRFNDLLRSPNRQVQYTLYDGLGPIGSIWTGYLVNEESIRRDDLIWIERLPLDVAPLRIAVNSVFKVDGALDEFDVLLENPATRLPIKLHGERFHADFSFAFEHGPLVRAFKLPLTDGGLIAGLFNPFAEFRELRLGQTWRMQVFNPIAAVTNVGSRFVSVLACVTAEERIQTGNWEGNCLVVEAGDAKAWVDANGEVRVQEVSLPMLGKLRMVREPSFDADRRNVVRKASLGRKGS